MRAAVKLRRWQAECIDTALQSYRQGGSHFLCLATPGAGKTTMASVLARKVLDAELADLVICLSPSIIVSQDFQSELELRTGCCMNGGLGAKGRSLTYQSMLTLDKRFWSVFDSHKVFVIFDEIHHCSGQTSDNANAWGQTILLNIQGRATCTLALTGTPWRSDNIPIALANYCRDDKIACDYIYGMAEAVSDKVCRLPQIHVIDNDNISITGDSSAGHYTSFEDLLTQSDCSYQQLLDNDSLLIYMMQKASMTLSKLRHHDKHAGGLFVAASVEHARKIRHLLRIHFDEDAAIATYQEDNAATIIRQFKTSDDKWIVAVGMISEGTNIPRLRVCCHLTRVKTELHFRQVLGRILRARGGARETAYLYMPAEPTLMDYARRVADDIPHECTVRFDTMTAVGGNGGMGISLDEPTPSPHIQAEEFSDSGAEPDMPLPIDGVAESYSLLGRSYDATLDVFGRYKHQIFGLETLS